MNRDQILTALRERILAFATSRVSRDHAEDLTQDTMTVLHEKYPMVSELTELVPLAFQVMRYKMLDAHRKALRHGEYHQESVEDLPLTDTDNDPVTQLDPLPVLLDALMIRFSRVSSNSVESTILDRSSQTSYERQYQAMGGTALKNRRPTS